MSDWTLYTGDALTILPGLSEPVVDTVLTDPLRNSGRRTGAVAGRAGGGEVRDRRGHLAWLSLVLAQCHRLTRPGGTALVVSTWRDLPVTSDALQAAGYVWRGVASWNHRQEGRFIVWGTRGGGPGPVLAPAGAYCGGEEVVLRQLARTAPDTGLVLDPVAGAAASGVAALAEGRRFLGITTPGQAGVAQDRLAGAAVDVV